MDVRDDNNNYGYSSSSLVQDIFFHPFLFRGWDFSLLG